MLDQLVQADKIYDELEHRITTEGHLVCSDLKINIQSNVNAILGTL